MTNLDIAQQATLRSILEVAAKAGLQPTDYEPLGNTKAKLTQEAVRRFSSQRKGKLVLVTAVSPTPAGEGKTTVTVGLSQGLQQIGKNAIPAIREPALGPIFGIKGGACGGGYSQVLPMEDINLFFTGDFPAISAAHNLLSALLDAHLQHGNSLEIDTRGDLWPRTMDMNDRALRQIVIGLGGKSNGVTREDGFVITPASEIMAILCLSTSLANLKERLGSIVIGQNKQRKPVFARDLQAHGAMAALLVSAIRPNLVQTMEGGLAVVHGGPFGNIAHGCSSILGTQCALGMSEYTVTEAGFGADLGAEKFLNIVCPRLGYGPDAIVLVATIRALQHQGDGDLSVGFANLQQHLRHLQSYGPPVIVAINRRAEDLPEEHAQLITLCAGIGVTAVTCDPWGGGGEGCVDLAHEVVALVNETSTFKPLYDSETPAIEKLRTLVSKVYGGVGVELSDKATKNLEWLDKNGFGHLPVCVAKTQYSLSDNPELLNAPSGFDVHVREIRLSAGAGFLVAVCGEIMLMPGLGKSPTAFVIDVDDQGKISGLF
ncbi:MAG TPA: formate--tetrahydrofolate ligase [Fimbriimonadaceae bacterium]|nr:formate--tetrahydrofolate ligase [Fimbriimonadaceae bacterium]